MKKISIVLALLAALAACSKSSNPTAANQPGTGNSGGGYCDNARSLEASGNAMNASKVNFQDKAAVRQLFTKFKTDITIAVSVAPAEIKADVQLLAQGMTTLVAALDAVDFDITKVKPADLAALSDPKFTAASDRLNKYNERVCGIKQGIKQSPTPSP